MLAPVTEVAYGENRLLELNLKSAARYPAFLRELSVASGMSVDFSAAGTLSVALDRDQLEALRQLFEYQQSLGLQVKWLTSNECRSIEPALSPSTRGGIWSRQDGAVDPRVVMAALEEALKQQGITIERESVAALSGGSPAVVEVEGQDPVAARQVVIAAGCWSREIPGVPGELRRSTRPVKGQILRLKPIESGPSLIRNVVRTEEIYLVPRSDGQIVAGATVEEKGFDTTITAGGVFELLRASDEALPGIREMELSEASAGLRPGSLDNAPLLGFTSLPGVIAATGHYRNGVLLTPITSECIARLLSDGRTPEELSGFSPLRFASQ